MSTEPIRQVWQDGKREQLVADYLATANGWEFYKTPRYYFVDYLVNKLKPNGYANYIGGVEVKWMRSHSGTEVKFPYQKLQRYCADGIGWQLAGGTIIRLRITYWKIKDLFTKRSKFRKIERQLDYLDKKLEAWVLTIEELYVKK